MTRRSCKFPDDCGGGRRGHCRKCGDPVKAALNAERMKARKKDPGFEARRLAALRGRLSPIRSADVVEAKRRHLRALTADPVALAHRNERIRQAAANRRGYDVPPGAERQVAKWKRAGLSAAEIAAELARMAALE